ncbi:MAG: MFS transporter [Planctomycetota bacterium]|nr:MFS transporter [Planctomycetota bacterium]
MIEKLRRLPGALYFLFAGTTITRFGSFVFPYLTIYLSEARGYGVDRVGQILSVGSIGLLAGNFTGGWLTDRWSRKRTLIAALVLNALGFSALAFHFESGWFYALFLAVGYFGSGMYSPAANTVVADLAPEDIRPFAYTVNYVCVNLGMGLGPLLAGFLAAYSYNWIFVGDVATSLVCAGLIAIGVGETLRRSKGDAATRSGRTRSYGKVWLGHPIVLIFCLSFFFLIGPLMGLEYAVPLLVKTVFMAPLAFVGVIYTINAACILSLSFLIEKLIRERNEYLMMVVSGLFWTAGLIILLSGFSVVALMVCTVVWTIGEIIASILVPSFIAKRVAPAVKGRFMALNDIVRSFAGVVCPVGLGLIWSNLGVTWVLAVLAGLPAAGVLCYLAMLVFTARSRGARSAAPLAVET